MNTARIVLVGMGELCCAAAIAFLIFRVRRDAEDDSRELGRREITHYMLAYAVVMVIAVGLIYFGVGGDDNTTKMLRDRLVGFMTVGVVGVLVVMAGLVGATLPTILILAKAHDRVWEEAPYRQVWPTTRLRVQADVFWIVACLTVSTTVTMAVVLAILTVHISCNWLEGHTPLMDWGNQTGTPIMRDCTSFSYQTVYFSEQFVALGLDTAWQQFLAILASIGVYGSGIVVIWNIGRALLKLIKGPEKSKKRHIDA